MVRIALYADRPASFGGIETHMATLAKELCRLGHKVRLLFPRIVQGGLFADAARHGAILEAMDRAGIEKLVSRGEADIVHAHSHRASELAVALAERFGVRAVTTVHSPGQELPPPRGPHAVIAVSDEISESLSRRGIAHVRIVNGVDLERFYPAPAGRRRGQPLRVVYLGRVSPSKTAGMRALHEAAGRRQDVEVRYVADWAPHGSMSPSVAVENELRAADVALATGRGIREAMACGCAAMVLGAFWDGLVTPENVDRLERYNFSGRASRQRPASPSIAVAIRDLLSDRHRLAALKAFGSELARRRWDAREMARRTAAVYEDVMQRR